MANERVQVGTDPITGIAIIIGLVIVGVLLYLVYEAVSGLAQGANSLTNWISNLFGGTGAAGPNAPSGVVNQQGQQVSNAVNSINDLSAP